MEVSVFCLFYTPLQLLTCTGRIMPCNSEQDEKVLTSFLLLARHIQVLEVAQQVIGVQEHLVWLWLKSCERSPYTFNLHQGKEARVVCYGLHQSARHSQALPVHNNLYRTLDDSPWSCNHTISNVLSSKSPRLIMIQHFCSALVAAACWSLYSKPPSKEIKARTTSWAENT